MAKKILITGAAGFIGSHLVDLLLEKKIPPSNLRLLVRPGDSLINLPDKKFDIVWGDIRDFSVIKKAVEGVETIYHLAARIDFEGKTYAEYKDVNVDGTKNLLEACKKQDIQKFVFFSSIAVFGLPAAVGDIINWDETHPKTYNNFYGQSKWEGEELVMKAYRDWGIPYVIIRPASVYGPREKGPTLGLYRAVKRHQFFMIGDGLNKMHYVYVKDLVKGARLAQLSKRKTGDYILGGPEPTRFQDILKSVAGSINEDVPRIKIPKSIALILGYGMEWIGKVIGITPPLYPSRIRTMTATYYYNINKAKKEINYNPQYSFQKGAMITGQWYLEHNLL